ncbi:hypothetical protein PG996_014682 [Apiospora saccharicola]|uniref:Uncharacterized protein n=1 Tax=Apiospora saccharicola TaxID=335842 RepID=A0ABR1TJ04_9PEZI
MADIPTGVVAALTTVFTPPPGCANRFAVFVASPTPIGGTSTGIPSSGWIDPSFTKCNPPQYTNNYPTFSPGVCPKQMSIVSSSSSVDKGKTRWTGACCQTGFSTAELDPQFICTSSVTTPMAFLLDPNISTADIYTTLSDVSIEHDQCRRSLHINHGQARSTRTGHRHWQPGISQHAYIHVIGGIGHAGVHIATAYKFGVLNGARYLRFAVGDTSRTAILIKSHLLSN